MQSALSGIKITVPTTTDKIPSTGKKVTLKPFRVGDEKSMLLASESQDIKIMVETLTQIVGNCVEGGYNIEDLTSYDIEYLFLKLRAFSVGETTDVLHACDNCGWENKIKVDIGNVEVIQDDDFQPLIKITDNLAVEMKLPDLYELSIAQESTDSFIRFIARTVKTLFHGEEAYTITEAEEDDLVNIINELTAVQFEKLTGYFSKYPRVVKDIKYQCKECGEQVETRLEGLASFF